MNLRDELHARGGARGAGDGLRSMATQGELGRRIARGRAVRTGAAAGGTVAALGLVTFGAAALPGMWPGQAAPAGEPSGIAVSDATSTAAPATPTPSSVASIGPVDPAQMPARDDDGYLVTRGRAWDAPALLSCGALADAAPPDGAVFTADAPTWPVPSWLETGRLYGWGDDALIGGYPIPVGPPSDGGEDSLRATLATLVTGDVNLVLTDGTGGVWGYTATWSDRSDLPHDPEGLFVELNADWSCQPDIPAEGVYEARLSYVGEDGTAHIAELSPMTVVNGVPSLPEVDAAGR